ncbi:MAG: alpha/beta hydrolase [Actinobacteria bacterium]|uniref:alpha/beta hydrolase n=1 Tax=Microbacterium sp. NPDC076895 TaxID=3154957 RepID=UPI0010011F81|nr:MAG: alpha/beta hydrolase [Actinomycetota bacterium]
MTLDADAQAVADRLEQFLPNGLSGLGVQGARTFLAQLAAASPPPPEIHEVTDRTIPGPRGEIPIRVYRPSDDRDLAVLVYFHGGGWATGDLEGGVDRLARKLSEQAGIVVVSVDYRLAPEHPFPVPFDDAFAAVEWVAANAESIGADRDRIAVGGDSAGANLAAAITLRARDAGGPDIRFQLLAYPITEYAVERPSWIENADAPLLTTADVLWFWDRYLADEADRANPLVTPSNADSLAGLPAAFILTGEHDPIRDDGENYARLLEEAGNDVVQRHYSGVFHGFFTIAGIAKSDEAVADAVAQLNRNLGRS